METKLDWLCGHLARHSLSRFALNPPIRTKVSLLGKLDSIALASHPIKRLSTQRQCNALFLTSNIPVPFLS